MLAPFPSRSAREPGAYETWLADRERALAEFATRYPEATPEEFADAVAAYPACAAESSPHETLRDDLVGQLVSVQPAYAWPYVWMLMSRAV